ncbi:bifunctional DNA primase/polymerase [Streptomyces sp. NPDC003691]
MTRRGRQWLSDAADDPEKCRSVWADDPRVPHLFPAGLRFDVVVVDQRTGLEVFHQLQQGGMPCGPVLSDLGSKEVGFLLNTGSRKRFERTVATESGPNRRPSYSYLAEGSFVLIPGPMPLSGDRYQWIAAPTRPVEGSPLRAVALAVVIVATTRMLDRFDQYGTELPTLEPEDWPEETTDGA